MNKNYNLIFERVFKNIHIYVRSLEPIEPGKLYYFKLVDSEAYPTNPGEGLGIFGAELLNMIEEKGK